MTEVTTQASGEQMNPAVQEIDPATATAEQMLSIPSFVGLLREHQSNTFEPHDEAKARSRLRARIEAAERCMARAHI